MHQITHTHTTLYTYIYLRGFAALVGLDGIDKRDEHAWFICAVLFDLWDETRSESSHAVTACNISFVMLTQDSTIRTR